MVKTEFIIFYLRFLWICPGYLWLEFEKESSSLDSSFALSGLRRAWSFHISVILSCYSFAENSSKIYLKVYHALASYTFCLEAFYCRRGLCHFPSTLRWRNLKTQLYFYGFFLCFLLSRLIRRSSNRRNVQTLALRFLEEGKNYEDGSFRERWRQV